MSAGQKTLKPQLRMPRHHFAELRDGLLRETAAGFVWKRLSAQAELKDDFVPALLQRTQKDFIYVRGIRVSFRWPSVMTALKGLFHFGRTDNAIIDIGRNVRRG